MDEYELPAEILDRRAYTERRLSEIKGTLRTILARHDVSLHDDVCIYATGSGGRGEMSEASDLDAFVVFDGEIDVLKATEIQAVLIHTFRECGLERPSRDGFFLSPHSKSGLTKQLGSPADDHTNTLTARMLLLLESVPLDGESVHQDVVQHALSEYWMLRDLHPGEFLPFMLTNDIIRYWRIVLLNHESHLRDKIGKVSEAALGRERKYRSYKMRFARCTTCFSALTYMLSVTRNGGDMTQDQAAEMVRLAPLARLERIGEAWPDCAGHVQKLLGLYGRFLERSKAGKRAFMDQLETDSFMSETVSSESTQYTEAMLALMSALRDEANAALYRHMVI